ncbi:hypothetical protein KIH86_00590 [Paenibacillus sp. HN-1]|uniref:hypothetical protein n=1 Tax=Paenibacillus TaxID=44249 RepID=UPI001CA868E3|nr:MULTISPECIES: hypothetical protein [Paenibacillus]MBY9079569.1 hypothetical protein [Paenibacillus sp. CGMCC 1.18879]MBY9082730.1 hypothetical protein [Paenibacillus sinensis]
MKKQTILLLIFILLVGILSDGTRTALGEGLPAPGVYHYDSNGRLILSEAVEGYITYEYDRNGNLIRKRIKGFGDLETPSEVYNTAFTVQGWYMDKNGVDSIKVYLNNTYQGLAVYGDQREDLYATYPKMNNHYAGFHYSLSLPRTDSTYQVKVVVRNKSGEETTLVKSFKFVVLPIRSYLDDPTEGSSYTYYINQGSSNQITVSGWYLDMIPVQSISLYFNNSLETSAYTTISREDVYNVYPQYGKHASGFRFTTEMPYPTASTSSYQIKVVITNTSGVQTVITRNVSIKKSSGIVITDPIGS